MKNKRELQFVMIGVVVGGFIAIFYDIFKYWFGQLNPDPKATPIVMAVAGVIAVMIGLALVIVFNVKPRNPES